MNKISARIGSFEKFPFDWFVLVCFFPLKIVFVVGQSIFWVSGIQKQRHVDHQLASCHWSPTKNLTLFCIKIQELNYLDYLTNKINQKRLKIHLSPCFKLSNRILYNLGAFGLVDEIVSKFDYLIYQDISRKLNAVVD